VGELLAVEEFERVSPVVGGRYPSVRCSDLADDIIDYSSTKDLSNLAREMGRKCIRMYREDSCLSIQ